MAEAQPDSAETQRLLQQVRTGDAPAVNQLLAPVPVDGMTKSHL